jgi:hypothetical protein
MPKLSLSSQKLREFLQTIEPNATVTYDDIEAATGDRVHRRRLYAACKVLAKAGFVFAHTNVGLRRKPTEEVLQDCKRTATWCLQEARKADLEGVDWIIEAILTHLRSQQDMLKAVLAKKRFRGRIKLHNRYHQRSSGYTATAEGAAPISRHGDWDGN